MTTATWRPAKPGETPGQCVPEAWFGCPNPDLCEDPECVNPVHLPDREPWTEAEELASWVEDDTRQRRRQS